MADDCDGGGGLESGRHRLPLIPWTPGAFPLYRDWTHGCWHVGLEAGPAHLSLRFRGFLPQAWPFARACGLKLGVSPQTFLPGSPGAPVFPEKGFLEEEECAARPCREKQGFHVASRTKKAGGGGDSAASACFLGRCECISR